MTGVRCGASDPKPSQEPKRKSRKKNDKKRKKHLTKKEKNCIINSERQKANKRKGTTKMEASERAKERAKAQTKKGWGYYPHIEELGLRNEARRRTEREKRKGFEFLLPF